ncbi:alpha/beta hydrolase family protein [Neptunicella sp. SCSIO 80796]|uniref:alpha/beta hydrolase family protein n=1 Tax=Neptunicella plasticusilytica TaxID=3117012 RepID=UPI003A4D827F
MRLFKRYLLLFIFLSMNIGQSQAQELIPLEHLAALPMIESPQLSPDGKNILALSALDTEQSVVVAKYNSVDLVTILKLKKAQDRIDWVRWANNERVLVYSSYPKTAFGRKVMVSRLFAINIDGSELRELKLGKLLRHDYADLFSDLKVLTVLPDDKEHILVQTYTGRDKTPAVFRFNIYNGDVEKVVSAAEEITRWLSTRDGEVLLGLHYDFDKDTQEQTVDIFFRENSSVEEWQKIYSYKSGLEFYFSPIAFSDDRKSLFVMTDFEVYKRVLRKFDLQNKEFGEIVYQVDGYDLDGAVFRDNKLAGVSYTDDYYRIVYFDEELKARQEMLQKSFSKYQSYIVSSSQDKNKLIISASSTNSPKKYFLVDLATKKANFWLSQYAYLENKSLPGKEPFSFKARDGYELSGYITFGPEGKNAPLVILPHGGPSSRDTKHFDIWVQMLARRGYAVAQVNFRGSEGFGNSHEVQGYKQWGKLMQQDVYDAIAAIKANHWADTDNMCIVGASYGGYVALTAGYQRPDLFKCIVSVAGISDIPAMVEKDSFYDSFKAHAKNEIGDVSVPEDLADLTENSAINHVGAFKAPVLLIHGENDEIVHHSQSEDMYDALKKQRKDSKLVLLEYGTHYVDSPKNRQKAFEEIDKFLKQYL